ncbi:Pre-mRNA-splicing factor cwf16 [Cytospora mali]|uniref:Splicing factor YJU2 n=1 Tax=Cytospora mali TaxID=578113 RepID=A0A194UM21_CYTMA|nr:Pre-mRNA-splicing factor cwf16 [Valsa mali var. pyri (nom. inval.)]
MSERKVLSKYYPPDFDPRQLTRKKGPKQAGPRVQTVRLMAPFSMKCTSCGEYIYKGRKFNARKETPEEEKYLGIQIFRFYIRCTRCSAEITFKTDPKNQDYTCERGAKRNTEPWRKVDEEETDEQRLDRLEQEEEERNAMQELEAKTVDAKREMAIADALDEIRTRNARMERANHDGMMGDVALVRPEDEQRRKEDEEDEDAYRRAVAAAKAQEGMWEVVEDDVEEGPTGNGGSNGSNGSNGLKRKAEDDDEPQPSFTFKKPAKKKEQVLIPGLKKNPVSAPIPAPTPKAAPNPAPATKAKASLVDYGSDSD